MQLTDGAAERSGRGSHRGLVSPALSDLGRRVDLGEGNAFIWGAWGVTKYRCPVR